MELNFEIDKNGTVEFTMSKYRTDRKHKRKSELVLLNNYVVIDIETTGLDPKYDEIIELGAQKYINNILVGEYYQLVKPVDDESVDEFITDLTGITNDMLKDAPSLEDVLSDFVDFLGDFTLIAHNANFDINFLYDSYLRLYELHFNKHFVDTLRLSRLTLKDFKSHKLSRLAKELSLGCNPNHRVSSDCEATHLLYQYIKKYIDSNDIDFNSLLPKSFTLNANEIHATRTEFDTTHPIYGKNFVFTGILEKMVRRDAMQMIVDLGGISQNGVNKDTNYLVLGNNDYCASIKDGKSSKHKKAEKCQLNGQDIQIISENVFYDFIE